jgi:hypothetical protein
MENLSTLERIDRLTIHTEERLASARSSETYCPSPKYPEPNIVASTDAVLTVMSFDRGMSNMNLSRLRRTKSKSRRFSDPVGAEKSPLSEKALLNLKTLIDDLENIDIEPQQREE